MQVVGFWECKEWKERTERIKKRNEYERKKRSHFVMSEYDSMGDSNMAVGKVVYELLANNNSSINSTITRAAGLGNRRW